MDKCVLLALLCLQAFLLITTFTATDAAALVKDDLPQLPPDLVKTPKPRGVPYWLGCWRNPAGCGILPPAVRPNDNSDPPKEDSKSPPGNSMFY